MAKSYEVRKRELKMEHPEWSEDIIIIYLQGFYDGIMDYMWEINRLKEAEYLARLQFQKDKARFKGIT